MPLPKRSELKLTDHAKIAVIGGGPAGSMVSYFLLELSGRIGLPLQVDCFEPRDFSRTGPPGCNMCAGVVSESLVQLLAAEGINLPRQVVQRGIDAYVLHTSGLPSVTIDTPAQESRIATVYRGSGPRPAQEGEPWSSFDGFLLDMACQRGTRHIKSRVTGLRWDGDRPQVLCKGEENRTYDLLIGAVGVNSSAVKLFEEMAFGYHPPPVNKGFLTEIHLGLEQTQRYLGNAMHIFLLDIPGLKFAGLIPKLENVTVCLMGDNIDKEVIRQFMTAKEVQECFPPGMALLETPLSEKRNCLCMPKLNLGLAQRPYHDRVVLIGDCAISRLYKDGIGAAYTMAKACAVSSIFFGISAQAFEKQYWPICTSINQDNQIGKVLFAITSLFQRLRFLRFGMVRMVNREQTMKSQDRAMSWVLWDTFTGSATYRDIFLRTLHPLFGLRLMFHTLAGIHFLGRIWYDRFFRP